MSVEVDDQVDGDVDVIGGLAGQLNVVHARLTAQMGVLLETDGWRVGGKRTPSEFLVWQAGVSPSTAKAIVKVAQRRVLFPNLVALFDAGQLSLDQMAAGVEAPPWADSQDWDHFCRISTVPKIRRALRSNMFTADPDDPDPPAPAACDRVSFGIGHDGRWRLSANLSIDAGRRVEAALTERRDAQYTEQHNNVNDCSDDGEPDPAARGAWADALVDVAERSLDAVESRSRRDRYRTWLHLDVTNGAATTTDGWRIPMSISDRVLCDGVAQPVWASDGVPFSVGRAQHIVPPRTRRIVELRDRGCQAPGCSNDRFVEIHHIIHWLDGGATDTWNLISLCPHHHRLHHRGELGITGNADHANSIVFTDADGRVIPGRAEPVTPTGPPPAPSTRYRNPLNGRFDWSWLSGWEHPSATRQRVTEIERRRSLFNAA